MGDRRRDLWTHRPDVRNALTLDRLGKQLDYRTACVRTLAAEHLEEHHAKRVDVGANVNRMRIRHLLRGHVGRRADDHACRSDRGRGGTVVESRYAQVC